MRNTVVGLFNDVGEAERAFQDLVKAGFPAQGISVVTNATSQRAIEARSPIRFSAMMLSDVGKIAASGPLRDALSETKDASPALIGVLKRLGLSSDLAERYVSGVRSGETLESLIVDEADSEKAVALMKHAGDGKQAIPARAAGAGAAATAAGAAATMPNMGNKPETLPGDYDKTYDKTYDKAYDKPYDKASAETYDKMPGKKPLEGELFKFKEEERTIPIIREELRREARDCARRRSRHHSCRGKAGLRECSPA